MYTSSHNILHRLIRHAYVSVNRHSKHSNVIVMRHDGLGDWLLWLDSARLLRQFYAKKENKITLIGSESTNQLNKLCSYWDTTFARCSSFPLNNLYLEARKFFALAQADIFLNPVLNRHAASIARFCSAPQKITMDFPPSVFTEVTKAQREEILASYTSVVSVELHSHLLHANALFVESITGLKVKPGLDSLDFITVSPPPFEDYLLIAPGAIDPRRRWGAEKFAAVAEMALASGFFSKIVICGSKSEQEDAQRLFNSIRARNKAINLCGCTGMLELFGLAKHAKMILCNDSGLSHLAASYGIPSICILGGGHWGCYHPYPEELSSRARSRAIFERMDCYGCNWHCTVAPNGLGPYPCIARISVEAVAATMQPEFFA